MKRPTISQQLRKDGFVVALAARFAVMVHQSIAAGHAFQKVLVIDCPLPHQHFRQFQRILARFLVVFRFSVLQRFSLLAHGSSSQGRH
jgi:hypothetical protein